MTCFMEGKDLRRTLRLPECLDNVAANNPVRAAHDPRF